MKRHVVLALHKKSINCTPMSAHQSKGWSVRGIRGGGVPVNIFYFSVTFSFDAC